MLRTEWEALGGRPWHPITSSAPLGSVQGLPGGHRRRRPSSASSSQANVGPRSPGGARRTDRPAPRGQPGAPSPRTPHLTLGGSRPASSAGSAAWPRREPGGRSGGRAPKSLRVLPAPRGGRFLVLDGRGCTRPRPSPGPAPAGTRRRACVLRGGGLLAGGGEMRSEGDLASPSGWVENASSKTVGKLSVECPDWGDISPKTKCMPFRVK